MWSTDSSPTDDLACELISQQRPKYHKKAFRGTPISIVNFKTLFMTDILQNFSSNHHYLTPLASAFRFPALARVAAAVAVDSTAVTVLAGLQDIGNFPQFKAVQGVREQTCSYA
ncbi:hypothetical protein FB451DRAFT_1177139 [Mycena latifolia]|nr:hypothetical protein FB451DRAFT_1177139 [Mycena latifolia]